MQAYLQNAWANEKNALLGSDRRGAIIFWFLAGSNAILGPKFDLGIA